MLSYRSVALARASTRALWNVCTRPMPVQQLKKYIHHSAFPILSKSTTKSPSIQSPSAPAPSVPPTPTHLSPHFSHGLVLGCGSVVVDKFYKVKTMPKSGEKGYFESFNSNIESASVVGGVTLNHLSWSSIMGVPTGLLSLQGKDEVGKKIRSTMKSLNVSTDYIIVKDEYISSVSMIFLDSNGERCIIMSPGSTSLINQSIVEQHFSVPVLSKCSMLTTEISQVPLSGVENLIQLAKSRDSLTLLDIDVPPSVAVNEAKLGDMDTLKRIIHNVDVLKPTLESAIELINLLDPKGASNIKKDTPLSTVASRLLGLVKNASLVALTDGSRGAGLATRTHSINIPCFKVSKVIDTTGAGDAFFGGLIAGIWHYGIPTSEKTLKLIGELSSAAGASCVQLLGALPKLNSNESINNILSLVPSFNNILNNQQTVISSSNNNNISSSSQLDNNNIIPINSFEESLSLDKETLIQLEKIFNFANAERFTTSILSHSNRFITGVGKSGVVGTRLAASLSSIGIPTQFVHATEWLHGDFGRLRAGDCVILISHSGNTAELLTLLPYLEERGISIYSITGNNNSPLSLRSKAGSIIAPIPIGSEPFNLVPTASVIVQEAISNILVRGALAHLKAFAASFRANHPGGTIGGAGKRLP